MNDILADGCPSCGEREFIPLGTMGDFEWYQCRYCCTNVGQKRENKGDENEKG